MKELRMNIPEGAQNIVIFVHGFGVRWDSREMYTDIAQELPSDWGSVLFDFYEVQEDHVYIEAVKSQVNRLQTIISDIGARYSSSILHIIAHSKGCIVASLLGQKVDGKVLFLAPPEAFSNRFKSYFERVEGAEWLHGELVVPRKDGTTSHIPEEYFTETAKINPERVMLKYSENQPIHILQTTKDEVIGETTYQLLQKNPNIVIEQMSADHNFTGASRQKLITYIKTKLTL